MGMSLADIFSYIWNVDLSPLAGIIVIGIVIIIAGVILMGIYTLTRNIYEHILDRNPKIRKAIDYTIGAIGIIIWIWIGLGAILLVGSLLGFWNF